ncbi:hypothetical protein [Streptomyces sp. NPDC089919]|uniref:hypothetical protein n=1 Tax=Streptomyces sp. NPDC089919 TaxID=3155188 RepID=UPI003418CD3F
MATFTELQLGDGTPVRFEVLAAAPHAPGAPGAYEEPAEGDPAGLPEGMGPGVRTVSATWQPASRAV